MIISREIALRPSHAIAWATLGSDLCRHMMSQGHNELTDNYSHNEYIIYKLDTCLLTKLMISWIEATLFPVILQVYTRSSCQYCSLLIQIMQMYINNPTVHLDCCIHRIFFINWSVLKWYICNWIQQTTKWYFFWGYLACSVEIID